jgi:thiol-disulfide isomerase/thioredoxin
MYRLLLTPCVLLLLLPALRAEDRPKETTRDQPKEASRDRPAAEGYKALLDEFLKVSRMAGEKFQKATTDEEKQKIVAGFARTRSEFAGRFLAWAEKHAGDKEASKDVLDALVFALRFGTSEKESDKALHLLENYAQSERIGSVLPVLAAQASPAVEKLLRDVLEKNKDHAIQAQACLSLATLLESKAESKPDERAKLDKETEGLLERVVEKYADIKPAAEEAKRKLFEIRHLAIGKEMPDISGTDAEGKKLDLANYRGKVVVVDFWASWCGPCMAMVPHEKELVKRMDGKPFVLLGVNLDRSRSALEKSQKEHDITWHSIYDEDGKIASKFNVQYIPTIYVLDARGVIRYKGVRGEALDRAVESLLKKEAPEKKSAGS